MGEILDKKNRELLDRLQQDSTISIEQLAEQVALSRNACWRRIKTLEEAGVIKERVVILDAEKLGLPLVAVVMVRTGEHEAKWLKRFDEAVQTLPEIVSAWRMSGDLDYVLRVRVTSVAGYDDFYKKLTALVPMTNVSASFVLEEMKETTQVPINV